MKKCGFSILEVMIAIAVISSLGLGIYRLQLSQLSATQQALTRQLAMQSASNLANQIYAHLNYCNNGSTSRISSCLNNTNSNYTETAYTDDTSMGTNCNSNNCTEAQYADYVLFRWKSTFTSMNLPAGNILGVVCRDNSLTIPTMSATGCNGNGGLVIKMVWQSHLESAEATNLGSNNFIILPVPQR